jgi:hypothetical protein
MGFSPLSMLFISKVSQFFTFFALKMNFYEIAPYNKAQI